MSESPETAGKQPGKQLVGYCEPWTLRAGESIELKASSHQPGPVEIDIARLQCGDVSRYGGGFIEHPVENLGPWSCDLETQPITPGSYAVAQLPDLSEYSGIDLRLWVKPSPLDGPERIATLRCARRNGADAPPTPALLEMELSGGRLRVGAYTAVPGIPSSDGDGSEKATAGGWPVDGVIVTTEIGEPFTTEVLTPDRWYQIRVYLDSEFFPSAVFSTPRSRSAGRDDEEGDDRLADFSALELAQTWDGPGLPLYERFSSDQADWGGEWVDGRSELWLGAGPEGQRFDGRISRPCLRATADPKWPGLSSVEVTWDLAANMGGREVPSDNPAFGPLVLHQAPTRAVTGPTWDGSVQRWSDDPSQYDAIHFHSDDVYDAAWPTTVSATLPEDLPSGIYTFRVRGDAGEDRVPFFVRPAKGAPTADVALLMPTATYMAYANHRTLIDGADFMPPRSRLRPEHAYIRDHPEIGLSHYEKHADRSGVMLSSRRRPVLNLRPGADGWNFTPDTDINAFIEHLGIGHDIVTDEDLHFEGVGAIAPYRVLVTGSHPEYWSTAMLDALDEWQRNGGRLMYLGGNGFYWRVAFSDAWPGSIELRRAEDGVRNWQTGPGESYHAWGGEYGGMWRRQGRAPNEICGIGFAAQGFEKATYYVRNPDADDSRAAWILEGVEGERIGELGLGGGAAGQEIDRHDVLLGSPRFAVILASATDFGPDMLRTKEEFEGSIHFTPPDPKVRADMVFYETVGGGAVFSVGSISWFGALAVNGYDNDVARITENVLRRFVDPEPIEWFDPNSEEEDE